MCQGPSQLLLVGPVVRSGGGAVSYPCVSQLCGALGDCLLLPVGGALTLAGSNGCRFLPMWCLWGWQLVPG
jgi:hypothetical protein